MANNTWIAQLHKLHFRGLTRFLRRKNVRDGEAEALAQDAFMKLMEIRDLSVIADPEAYLFTVAANLARDHKKAWAQKIQANQLPIEDTLTAEQLVLEVCPSDSID